MTSPVDFISGPRMVSTLGKREKENTASLTAMCSRLAVLTSSKSTNFSPDITRAAILAIGRPVALATKGTVRLARGLTSRM